LGVFENRFYLLGAALGAGAADGSGTGAEPAVALLGDAAGGVSAHAARIRAVPKAAQSAAIAMFFMIVLL
jgi:hypothetical protein